jgi:malate dehydrogenase (oxaloacetate-decarboxylating)
MTGKPYDIVSSSPITTVRVRARGNAVLTNRLINRGTAFTLEERQKLGLVGLLPNRVSSMDGQLKRIYGQYLRQPSNLARYGYLANLRDRNEVLFYRLLSEHIDEMLPIVYTPTIGEAIERFSHEYRQPRGVFLSIDHPEDIEQSFLNYGLGANDVDLIVATDSEGILGIGDQGVGGIQISIGKLSVYTAAAGIHPRRVIPVVLDVGTDNLTLLNDEMYLGERHSRVRGAAYDEFIEAYVETATKLFPHALLHWEDFGTANARRILDTYADRCCTFNDDMQGTAAVVLAAALAGVRATGSRLRDQRIVIYGAGTAGMGVADLMRDAMVREGLPADEATRRFYCLDRRGLMTQDRADSLRDFQVAYARPVEEVARWTSTRPETGSFALADVVREVHPTMLIGTSTHGGAFTEAIVKDMAAHVDRPIVMPLSNPTSRAEAIPAAVLAWTDGRALVATGSPFEPVTLGGHTYEVAQANNALVFPGLGLGVAVCKARRINDAMIMAAADAVAGLSNADKLGAPLLPSMSDLRPVSASVAVAVAGAAAANGLAEVDLSDPIQQVHDAMWRPDYPVIEVI